MRERRNTRLTCSGVALVAMSKSLGALPKIKSRTAPPTTKASNPAACKPSQVFTAPVLNKSRLILWSLNV